MVFDGTCDFCKHWIARWKKITGDSIEYIPFQEVDGRFKELSRQECEKAVHLIERDGEVFQAAEAVFRSLARNPRYAGWLRVYRVLPGMSVIAEAAYRFIANNRSFASWLTRKI